MREREDLPAGLVFSSEDSDEPNNGTVIGHLSWMTLRMTGRNSGWLSFTWRQVR